MAQSKGMAKALVAEIEELRFRLEEAEETLRAIGSGVVDAFVVSGPEGEQVFTLRGAEQPYRVLVETMNEGAATLTADGTILYCNNRLATLLQVPLERLMGARLVSFVAPADRDLFSARLQKCQNRCEAGQIIMVTGAGSGVPVLVSCCANDLSGSRHISMVLTDLSQQKRNEEIIASERLAGSIIEQAGEAIVVCDEGGTIIRASRLVHQLCAENPLLKPFDELFQLQILDTDCLFSVATPLGGGSFESVEVTCERGDNQSFHLLLNATPLKDAQGRIIGCVVILTDISERKQAEELLRLSEMRYRSLFENMMEGFCYCKMLYDEQGAPFDFVYLEVNDAFERLTGLDDVRGKRVTQVLPGIREFFPQLFEIYSRVAATGQPERLEMEFKPLSAWLALSVHSTEKGYFLVVFDDITERKKTEEALKQSEQRLAMALEGGGMGLWEWDTRSNHSVWNATEYQLLGLPIGSGTELTRRFFDRVHPDDLAAFNRILAEVMERGSYFRHEVRITRADDGQERWLAAAGRISRDAAGQPLKMLGVNYDITPQKRAEEALQRVNEELESRVAARTAELATNVEKLEIETAERVQAVQALREKEQMLIQQSRQAAMGEMIGNIAHQWRQPLNSLALTIQKMELFYEIGEFDKHVLEESVGSSMGLIHHMSKTIDDFRNFFKPEKEKAVFRASEAVANMLALIEGSFRSERIEIEVVASDDPLIYGYHNEFIQVLLNIMNNARDALTEKGVVHPKIAIVVGGAAGCASVTIADNAGGIPEDILEKVFDPYFTTKGQQQGTGVGLFMSKTIIEKSMGGRLSVRNTGDGAEFNIEVCTGEVVGPQQ